MSRGGSSRESRRRRRRCAKVEIEEDGFRETKTLRPKGGHHALPVSAPNITSGGDFLGRSGFRVENSCSKRLPGACLHLSCSTKPLWGTAWIFSRTRRSAVLRGPASLLALVGRLEAGWPTAARLGSALSDVAREQLHESSAGSISVERRVQRRNAHNQKMENVDLNALFAASVWRQAAPPQLHEVRLR
jgi:hypothetical protein